MKRTRKLAIGIALAAVVGIPGSAMAQGSDTCFGESVKQFHSAFMSTAQSNPGGVRDLLEWIRANEDQFSWCG